MVEPEKFYEMLWDCERCEARGLLGTRHRHCPMCGATQNPARRYFPPAGKEVEAKDHVFVGVDWHCGYCQSPNSAAARFCVNCGAGQDGSKPVALIADGPAAVPLKVAAPLAKGRSSWRWLLVAVGLVLVLILGLFFSEKEAMVQVAGHSWERSIAIERYRAVREQAWCDSLPVGAYGISRSREVRTQRQVEAGQDCTEVRLDRGDGSFSKKLECVPRYVAEPVYDERCTFSVNRWQVERRVVANQDNAAQPVWPVVGRLSGHAMGATGATGATVGVEREGARHERFTLNLVAQDGSGKSWQCEVDAERWGRLQDGEQRPLKVRLTGGADCDSLR